MEPADRPGSLALLRPLEQLPAEACRAGLCTVAGAYVAIPDEEARAAIRRAELLLAAGGDPRRDPDVDGRAVRALAEDLDLPERRAALRRALEALAPATATLPAVGAALATLLADGEHAWRTFALTVLADRDDA